LSEGKEKKKTGMRKEAKQMRKKRMSDKRSDERKIYILRLSTPEGLLVLVFWKAS
jgi:hypothetical protein